jgi:hypothetical protein
VLEVGASSGRDVEGAAGAEPAPADTTGGNDG